jgi:ABC-2 type transport system ATP-binding protein
VRFFQEGFVVDVTISQLTKIYRDKVRALNGIDLTIPNGMFGLLGPNGAGKTTLMRIIAGILRPTSGSLQVGSFDGTSERGRTAIKRVLGYLPQDLGLYPDLSAREFLDYIAILKGLDDTRQRKQRVAQLLDIVSLSDVAGRKIKTFSGGMKRRVGIAQALLNDPQLLIVDEPTAGLDTEERIRFRNLLAELGGDRVVLLSTHIVEDIAQTCRNLAVLHNGCVIFQGTTADMVAGAVDKVGTLVTNGSKPAGSLNVVAALNTGDAVHYRVIGDLLQHPEIMPAEPTLEDSYVWLMHARDIAAV